MFKADISSMVFVLFAVFAWVEIFADDQKFFKVCNRDDPDVDDCLKDAIQDAMRRMSIGVPELDIPGMDPYEDKEDIFEYKKNQIYGKAYLKNVKVFGFGEAKVLAVRSSINDDSFELEVDLSCDRIFIEGYVKGEGRLNALVIRSKGYFNYTMGNTLMNWKLTGTPEDREGERYMKIVKFYMRLEIGNLRVHIPDISDNQDLNRLAYTFANNYWRPVYRELLPVIEKSWDKVSSAYANTIFLKIPHNKLFPISL